MKFGVLRYEKLFSFMKLMNTLRLVPGGSIRTHEDLIVMKYSDGVRIYSIKEFQDV